MGVSVQDHRRYAEGKLAESIKTAEEKVAKQNEQLLPQAESEFATTGDDKLDKVVRAVQEVLNTAELHVTQVAHAGISCVNEELLRKHQAEYFFTQGKMATYKEVFEIVARVVTEAKVLHKV